LTWRLAYDSAERRASYERLAAAVGIAPPPTDTGRSTVTTRRSELKQA
jgi:hypothetical protein